MNRILCQSAMRFLLVTVCVVAVGCAHVSDRTKVGRRTSLDRYVAAADSNYSYKLVNTIKGEGVTTYVLEMTSQSWRNPKEVDRPLWTHWVVIAKPDKVSHSTGLLFIGGGRNGGEPPDRLEPRLGKVATATESIVTELRMVPNQPLVFVGDETRQRSEDELIAYTWDKFMRTGDDLWPARLPMTKSAVRAMDTVTSFCASAEGGNLAVNTFVVAGGSKRGWTTWTTAAVDNRVIAIIPMVIDLLNLQESFKHHYAAYGFWAEAVGDYTDMKVMDWMNTREYDELMKIVEPFSYRKRLTLPKFIMNASGDEFFLPDSSQFYWDKLLGEKYLRYVPNTGHSLARTDAVESLVAFYYSILNDKPRPRYSWKVLSDGAIRVETPDQPLEVKLWQATNPNARDFRFQTIKDAYQSSPLAEQSKGVYLAQVPKPEKGWTAYFVELTFPSGGPVPFKVTSQVCVTPDTLPFEGKLEAMKLSPQR
ncbi:MAG: PhoPQ-activated pathogenicity-related family protein [Candidatus Hydrogenedentes bacterium]|nr:PhoPQ-activated pathogenicity-related family protein [Candidatus Hydrogenedentota bacterium]